MTPSQAPDEREAIASSEMAEGYMDGFNLDNPEPSDNRSHSYRHGFANGRADKTGKPAFPTAQVARTLAQAAIDADHKGNCHCSRCMADFTAYQSRKASKP